jgi:hypothetical protein
MCLGLSISTVMYSCRLILWCLVTLLKLKWFLLEIRNRTSIQPFSRLSAYSRSGHMQEHGGQIHDSFISTFLDARRFSIVTFFSYIAEVTEMRCGSMFWFRLLYDECNFLCVDNLSDDRPCLVLILKWSLFFNSLKKNTRWIFQKRVFSLRSMDFDVHNSLFYCGENYFFSPFAVMSGYLLWKRSAQRVILLYEYVELLFIFLPLPAYRNIHQETRLKDEDFIR